MAGHEDRLIAWLAGLPGSGDRIGDDAALLEIGGRRFALSVDTQRAGIHIPIDLDPAIAARRLLAVSLSDLAATGAEPRWALAALGVDDEAAARRFLEALVHDCNRHGLELIGGDTARPTTTGRLDAGLTVIGEVPRSATPLLRDAARPGDQLLVGGPVGESTLGLELVRQGARLKHQEVRLPPDLPPTLAPVADRVVRRHLEPAPQLDLGLILGRLAPAGAAIDVSDGLAADVGRLCRASGAGCVLREDALALPEDAGRLARHLGLDPLDLTLGGGEDYVLAFTRPAAESLPHPECRRIGRITPEPGLRLQRADGTIEPLVAAGWDHLGERT